LIERLVPDHEHGIAIHRGVDLDYDRRVEGLAKVDPRHLADKDRVDLTYVQSHPLLYRAVATSSIYPFCPRARP
jgi:hypothetical protein